VTAANGTTGDLTVVRAQESTTAEDFDTGTKLEARITTAMMEEAKASSGGPLESHRTYYVRTDGSDSNDGLTDSAGGAFLTPQKAYDVASRIEMAYGYGLTISIAAGTYGQLDMYGQKSSIAIVGTGATPADVHIDQPTTGDGINVLFSNLTLDNGIDMYGGTVSVDQVAIQNGEISAQYGSVFAIAGALTIDAASIAAAFRVGYLSLVTHDAPSAIDLAQSTSWTQAMAVVDGGRLDLTASGSAATFTGSACTGARYEVSKQGLIDTGGSGATYLPGDAAGSESTGGLYV
jgi:hypothetical protein